MESISPKGESKKRLVSVIMAVWNGENTVKASIESVLSQTYAGLELIVVDDGSTDGTRDVVNSFSDERVRYFYQENSGGPSAPRNMGIKEAVGEFISFCDQEDLHYPEKITRQVEAYEQSKDRDRVGIIISSADIIDEKGRKIDCNKVPFEGFLNSKESFERLAMGDFITACSVIFPKKVVEEVGFLNEKLEGVDDYDLWLRITKKYGSLALEEPLCAWRKSKGSLSADKSRLYIETEKVFDNLDKDKVSDVGHGKNLMRIVVSLLLDKSFEEAVKYREKALRYPLSGKAKMILRVQSISPRITSYGLKVLEKLGVVSL